MPPNGMLRVASWVGQPVPYVPMLQLQEALAQAVHTGRAADTLLLVEVGAGLLCAASTHTGGPQVA
jgi:hypothetical protein